MKDQDAYLRELRRNGYITVRGTHTSHLRIFCPKGHLVGTHSGTGSDWRGLLNFKAEVRRHEQWHCSAGEQQSKHVQGEPTRDERRPDKPGLNHPRDNRGDRKQDKRNQDQETVRAAHGEATGKNHR